MVEQPPSAPPAGMDGSAGGVLVEPARLHLLGLAAEVVGRLAADQVPSTLRAVARFAPAKRVRLGGPVLAAALDGDDDFRASVAKTLADTSPELVAAVRDGGPTDAADPLDVAIVAYLTRPEGWRDQVDAAGRRWAAQRGVEAGHDAEVVALRAEVSRLRTAARGEQARIRDAVTAAAAESRSAAEALQRSLRERTRELRSAERDLEAARADAATLLEQSTAEGVAHDAESRRLRQRLADADRAAETARRATRSEREVDDARLWLLVDTLVQAASGVRRELSLAAPAMRPADGVGEPAPGSPSGGSAPGGRSVADVTALDRVLVLPHAHLVVDGYNVTKSGYGDLALTDQRTRLTTALAALGAQTGAEVTAVFDGGARPPVQPAVPRGVRVLFSASDEIADDVIRRLVAAEPAGRVVVVATSDRQVVLDTARDGAWSVASAVLLDRLSR